MHQIVFKKKDFEEFELRKETKMDMLNTILDSMLQSKIKLENRNRLIHQLRVSQSNQIWISCCTDFFVFRFAYRLVFRLFFALRPPISGE